MNFLIGSPVAERPLRTCNNHLDLARPPHMTRSLIVRVEVNWIDQFELRVDRDLQNLSVKGLPSRRSERRTIRAKVCHQAKEPMPPEI